MAEIVTDKPIVLRMEIAEVDDYLPSMKMFTEVQIKHHTGLFKYQADDIWFECSKWDTFSTGLLDLETLEILRLEDMSEQFEISITKKSINKFLFNCCCSEPELGQGLASLNFSIIIDSDGLSQLVNAFRDFPKWW